MNVFAPFILIYIPEHQFTSTVFVSKMCVMVTFHSSFHMNVLFCAFLFFCRRRRGTCLLTDCTVLRRQLFSINLQLLNIFYKELSCCFSFSSFVLSIYIYMHTNNTIEIRTVLSLVNVSMQQLTFISSLGLS